MSKLKITKHITKHNFSGRNGTKIKYIVVHDVGAVSTAKNNAIYFSNPVQPPVSAHYFVDATSIYQSVEDDQAAWHCGDGRGKFGITNQNSIGIEMCLTDYRTVAKATINKTIELVKELQQKYAIPNENVVRHFDASGKLCPASLSADEWKGWREFKIQIERDEVVAEKAPAPVDPSAPAPVIPAIPAPNTSQTGPKFKVNDVVTVSKTATHYQTGEKIAGFVLGSSYTVKKGKKTAQSHAYLLAPINSWVLEKDLTGGPAPTVACGCKWKIEKAKFTVTAPGGIRIRKDKPSVKAPQTGILKKGQSVDYSRYTESEGYIWIEFETGEGARYVPVRIAGKPAWGVFS